MKIRFFRATLLAIAGLVGGGGVAWSQTYTPYPAPAASPKTPAFVPRYCPPTCPAIQTPAPATPVLEPVPAHPPLLPVEPAVRSARLSQASPPVIVPGHMPAAMGIAPQAMPSRVAHVPMDPALLRSEQVMQSAYRPATGHISSGPSGFGNADPLPVFNRPYSPPSAMVPATAGSPAIISRKPMPGVPQAVAPTNVRSVPAATPNTSGRIARPATGSIRSGPLPSSGPPSVMTRPVSTTPGKFAVSQPMPARPNFDVGTPRPAMDEPVPPPPNMPNMPAVPRGSAAPPAAPGPAEIGFSDPIVTNEDGQVLYYGVPEHFGMACHRYSVQADFEALFLRYHRADGVRVGTDNTDLVETGFEFAPRITVGVNALDGLGARARWFDYRVVQGGVTAGDTLTIDTYSFDVELFDRYVLSPCTTVELSGGVRYNDFTERMFDNEGAGELRENSFDGYGGLIGAEIRRRAWGGEVFARTRGAVLMSDRTTSNVTSGVDLLTDTTQGMLEIAIGVERSTQLRNGMVLRLRAGGEWQNWFNYSSAFSGTDENVFEGLSDVGLGGFLLGVGLDF